MKRIYYIEKIKLTGLKMTFISEKLKVHQSTLSRFLHGSKYNTLSVDQVHKLDTLLERYL